MYKIAIYSIKSPLASITASMRPRTGHHDLGFLHGLKFLLDTFDQFVLHLAWNLASASLNHPPHKKVHWIQVRRVWRPNVRRDKINKVVAQPKLRFLNV